MRLWLCDTSTQTSFISSATCFESKPLWSFFNRYIRSATITSKRSFFLSFKRSPVPRNSDLDVHGLYFGVTPRLLRHVTDSFHHFLEAAPCRRSGSGSMVRGSWPAGAFFGKRGSARTRGFRAVFGNFQPILPAFLAALAHPYLHYFSILDTYPRLQKSCISWCTMQNIWSLDEYSPMQK